MTAYLFCNLRARTYGHLAPVPASSNVEFCMHQDDTPFCWLGGRKRSVSAPPRRPRRPAPTASSTSSGPSTSSAADSDLAAVVALVRAAGAALEHLEGELRCSVDDLFCTVSSANMHSTRTDVRAAVAYLRTEHEIVVDRDSQHRPGRDIIVFLED